MSGCVEFASSMTGSTNSGRSQSQKDSTIFPALSSSFDHHQRHQDRLDMTLVPTTGQAIQLTPLWEHVVRTKRFPSTVDVHSIFIEISERLRDPEWEVRQHALRVLVDVLPTLDANVIDKVLLPVVPELVSNLGHPAPAVRKGALDTLRIYLFYSQDKEMFKKILREGLNRPDALDNFQTNVTMGIILSVPSLLFPSASSPRPSCDILKEAITALAARLIQVTHQEVALRSLVKIRQAIGPEEFESCLLDCDEKMKRDFEVLCEVYNVNLHHELGQKYVNDDDNLKGKDPTSLGQAWESESDSSGIAEEDADVVMAPMPTARVILETDIKFNEETAITMTILDEKDEEESNDADDSDDESESDRENNLKVVGVFESDLAERRKTPRRVHFGGEVVKLRTPDSDDSGLAKPDEPKTRIPLPISPATKMPLRRHRPYSQPSSPHLGRYRAERRISRSQPSSPRREVYTYNADLSPKKSILSRTSSPVLVFQPIETRRIYRNKNQSSKRAFDSPVVFGSNKKDDMEKSFELCTESIAEDRRKEEDKLARTAENQRNFVSGSLKEIDEAEERKKSLGKENDVNEQNSKTPSRQGGSKVLEDQENFDRSSLKIEIFEKVPRSESPQTKMMERKNTTKESPKRSLRPSSKTTFETFPKQERNYILMELSSPVRKDAEEKESDLEDISMTRSPSPDSFLFREKKSDFEKISVPEEDLEEMSKRNGFLFAGAVNETRPHSENTKEPPTSDRSTNRAIDSLLTANGELVYHKTTTTSAQEVDTPTETNGSSNLKSESRDIFESEIIDNPVENSIVVTSSGSDEVVNSGLEGGKEQIFQGFKQNGADRETVKTFLDGSESLTCSSSEGENKRQEPNWEELGIVSQEVLNDLHNKDDWRARVRSLERITSALRTSSALAAIESRLGSLLHAVLGGERSCRVAAAGLAVAKVAVAGVSEEALKRRLPELACGLARQGGPNAAQLARIAMLRLRPALLLEQLLQLHCIGARNAKTRENALQLLIFSLVTFPSTEFKGGIIANKVATMLTDRRRRVRQAALDTLAVLAQIYEPEEVLQAGERAAKGHPDSESMMAAIRARLSRKSLPLVSADGLVVYGLQISPTVQIATGADVDWIVAGSGSVSPGSGRTRGQIIATTTKLDNENILRNKSVKNSGGSRTNGPNFVAIGVGLHSMDRQPMAWQLVPIQDDHSSQEQIWNSGSRIVNTDEKGVDEKLQKHYVSSRKSHESVEMETRNSGEFLADDVRKSEQTLEKHFHKQVDEFHGEKIPENSPPRQEGASVKVESRIPILHSRDRISNSKEISNGNAVRREVRNEIVGSLGKSHSVSKKMQESFHNNDGEYNSREQGTGYGNIYRRRRRLVEEQAFQALQSPRVSNDSFDPNDGNHYQSNKKTTGYIGREFTSRFDVLQPGIQEMAPEQVLSKITSQNYQKADNINRLSRGSDTKVKRTRSRSEEHRYEAVPKFAPNPQQSLPVRETYGSKYQRQRRLMEENSFSALQTGPNTLNHYSSGIQNSMRRSTENIDRDTLIKTNADLEENVSSLDLSKREHIGRKNNSDRGRQRSRSRSKIYHHEKTNRIISRGSQISLTRDRDERNVEEEEYNERNKRRSSSRADQMYQVQNLSSLTSEDRGCDYTRSSSTSSSASNLSVDNNHRNRKQIFYEQRYNTTKGNIKNNSRSSSAQTEKVEKAFAVVTQRSNLNKDTVDSYNISINNKKVGEPVESISLEVEEGTEKGSSFDGELRLTERIEMQSNQDNISHDIENIDDSDGTSDELVDENDIQRESSQSVLTNESILLNRLSKLSNESLLSNNSSKEFSDARSIVSSMRMSLKESGSLYSDKSISNKSTLSKGSKSTSESINNNTSEKSLETFAQKNIEEFTIDGEERILSSVFLDEKNSSEFLDTQHSHREANTTDSTSVLQVSRPHSKEVTEFTDVMTNVDSNVSLYSSDNILHMPSKQSILRNNSEESPSTKESTFNVLTPCSTDLVNSNNNENNGNELTLPADITKIETRSSSPTGLTGSSRKIPTRISRNKPKPRVNSIRTPSAPSTKKVEGPLEKPKLTAQQCFAQLESKDWEVTIKGLKTLSQVARYHPEHLEMCSPGTIGRLLGRHIRNLRSQVSRAACLAASDIFCFQIRGIEQDLDDIVGSLLHRTADTNRFLRADSNAALNCMIEHLPPHRTISIIMQRGATHQNAIVRAASARLLSEVVDHVGPDYVMNLPREARDKLLGTGAKLLIDGNLDARNYAKKMFRGLAHYEGFRKALTDSVPETTLRHIDKTLKSL